MAAPPEQSASEDLLDVVAQLEALLLTTAAAGGSAAATAAASTGVAGSSATAQEPLRLLRAHAERLHRQLQGVKRLEKRTEAASTVPVQRVKLNIGGTEFETTTSTLQKDPDSMLALMFSQDNTFNIQPDEHGAFFIDRDPTFFSFILNYLRDGEIAMPEDEEDLRAISAEADFYQIQGLLGLLHGRALREQALGPENIALRNKENQIRDLFASNPSHPLVQDPYGYLIDVFSEVPSFDFSTRPAAVNQKLMLLMAWDRMDPMPTQGLSICPSLDSYKEQFGIFTKGMLAGFDWSNVFVAGGCALGPLLPVPKKMDAERWYFGPKQPFLNGDEGDDDVQVFLDDLMDVEGGGAAPAPAAGNGADNEKYSGFQSSDLDIFLYGLNEAGALAKISYIYNFFKAKNNNNLTVLRTRRSLTLVSGYPRRNVQIVLRLYRSPAEVLLGFDLDVVSVGYDGDKVYCLPRARRALVNRYNIADPTRQTFRTNSYEFRLYKYAQRGFAVAVPGLHRDIIDPMLFLKRFADVKGLARILFLEARFELMSMSHLIERNRWLTKHGFRVRISNNIEMTMAEEDIETFIDDYNDGVLLPFHPLTSRFSAETQLHKLLRRTLKQGLPLRFAFSKSNLEEAIDMEKFKAKIQKPNAVAELSKNIEFVGSLAEYIGTLPDLDDWYKDALRKYL